MEKSAKLVWIGKFCQIKDSAKLTPIGKSANMVCTGEFCQIDQMNKFQSSPTPPPPPLPPHHFGFSTHG